ncbi:MAG: hypothetical protein GX771_03230 [Halomonadaceae bacterium]|nr:hypothetical protein [Halomonadaceae bacterium]
MDTNYSVVERGTTADRIMLWKPDFPIIEINVEPRLNLPKVALVDNTGLGQVVEAAFEDAPRLPLEVREAHRQALIPQLYDWMMTTTEDRRSLTLLDPSQRYQFQFVMDDNNLTIYLDDLHSEEGPWRITFGMEILQHAGAWVTPRNTRFLARHL